jgi:lipase
MYDEPLCRFCVRPLQTPRRPTKRRALVSMSNIFAVVLLHTTEWGSPDADAMICVHGVTQHGGVFRSLAERLVALGYRVVAVDLRGHGDSGREPPWSTAKHVDDLVETADALGIQRGTWIGHSFGGRLAADLADRSPERVQRLVLLDPGLEVPPAVALRSAEIDRLDWSFATVDGAVNALLSGAAVVATPKATVEAYVRDDVRPGPDGRLRFSVCPSAVVVAWSEMASPAPRVAQVPTLLVRPATSLADGRVNDQRYREALGPLLTITTVPNGHNVLWESPAETAAAVEAFVANT